MSYLRYKVFKIITIEYILNKSTIKLLNSI